MLPSVTRLANTFKFMGLIYIVRMHGHSDTGACMGNWCMHGNSKVG